jgi:hypothetical protein
MLTERPVGGPKRDKCPRKPKARGRKKGANAPVFFHSENDALVNDRLNQLSSSTPAAAA